MLPQITRISTVLYNRGMSELNLRSRMTNLLLVIPNLLLLSARLMVDPRVPAKERLLVERPAVESNSVQS